MRKCVLVLLAGVSASLSSAQGFVPGEVVVKFAPGRQLEAAAAQMSSRARMMEEVAGVGASRLKLDGRTSMSAALSYWRKQPFVEYAEPNYIYRAFETPNDPLLSQQWALNRVQAPLGWDLQQGSSEVVIAIVDTGVALAHPDLMNKLTPGRDFVNNDAFPDDDHGHGTHCAGIAAAQTNNGIGVAGISWNCRIMPVKVLSSGGSGSMTNVANGITWAVDQGAKVISLSLGGSAGSFTLQQAVDYAWGRGVIVVAAAGNDGTNEANYPAFYTNVIAVAASTQDDSRAGFSNYGSWVDVAAQGQSIQSTYLSGQYRSQSGTSMAAPLVAGLAGLVWGHLGTSTQVSLVRQRMEEFTDPVPGGYVVTGRVNAFKALSGVTPPPTVDEEFVPSSYQVLQGSVVSGSVGSLASDDGDRLVLRSTTQRRTRTSELTVDAGSGSMRTLTGLRVRVEAEMSPPGTLAVALWNWTSGQWDALGSGHFSNVESTLTWTATGTGADYQDGSGRVRVQLLRSRSSWWTFLNRLDRVRVVKVVAASG